MWGVLEKQFRVLPFRLLPLTKNEQINLLPKLWKYTASSENEQSEFEKNAKIFAEKFIKLTDTTLKDSLNLLGIPLHLILLAEVLKNQIVEFCKNGERDLPRRLDLLNLYSEFVDSKWNLYYDKIKLDRTVPGIDKLCEPAKLLTQDDVMNSAMVTLLNEDINQLSNAEEILKKNSNFIAKLDSGEEMVGLVTHVQNGKAVFVHRTFAEYFAAIWFSKNYLSNLDYFRKFYLSGSFETIRMFFDRILAHENVLHSYVLNCNIDDIRNLLADNNAVIDDLDRGGRTALHLAVANFLNLLFNRQVTTKINIGHLHFDLVNLPILVRQGSNKNVTYLLQIVELLLKKGADCSNIDNILSWTPVQFAENTGIWCLLDLLLEYYSVSPGDLSVIQDKILDQNFVTNVLEAAAVDECMNLMRLMFDYGACDSTFCCFSYKRTLLHVAAFLGHLKLTQFLIERGSDLEARDIFGLTALMASYVNDNQNVTIMLLQHGANPNAMCKDGNCVIHFAFRWTIQKFSKFSSDVEKNNEDNTEHLKSFFSKTKEDTVLNLLEHGANPNAVDGLGNSLMDYAVGADLPNILKLLQEFGCDINGCDYEQGTPLIKAIKWGNEKMAITLLEYGANPNVKDKHGNSAIHYAIQGNLSNTLELLLQHNCDIDAANNQGETPLIKSLTRRNEQMAMHLLQFKLNFNAKDYFGNSPMHYAVEGNLEKTSETLLKLECDFDCCNLQGETPLIKAIKRQNQEMANTLLSLGANPNTKDKYGNSVMHFAAQENLVNTVDELLVLESDFDYFNKEGETPLLKAVMRRNEDIAIKLLKHGAKPNAQDKYGNSVMHFAAEENLAITVDLLLSLECDFDNFNKDGETPLLKAVKRRNEQIAIKLLEHGPNPNLKDANGYSVIYRAVWMELPLLLGYLLKCNCDLDNTGKGETPLMYAITNHKEDMAIQLLEHGANPICGKCGNSAMHYAVLESLPRLLEWLLKSGDNVDVENDVGCTPLMNALRNRNEDMAIRLLQYGASHNSKSDKAVLHYYCENNLANIVEYLLKSNWDIEVCNNLGETPLVRAVKCGNDEMAMKLIQHGANPNAQDRSGNSVLHYAVLNNLSKFVRCVLKLGCNVNIPNAMGSTPLRYALRNHNENMAIILLEHGANPNTQDKSGNSVLHYAVMGNLTRLVACLLKSGCKTNIQNGIGWTPLRYAVLNRNEEIAIQLLENGANPNANDKSGNSVMHYINRSNLLMLQQWFLNKNSEEKELH
ncbi:hypothetical protein C0J52_06045 [Blattella germanica]|nr:hypothetical protein C0J52_06045 [Blattella germanica]